MRLLGSKRRILGQAALRVVSEPSGAQPAEPRLAPVGRNLPEKRSHQTDLGDLKTGRLHLIIGEPTASGEPVNESTAVHVAAVAACVSLLANMVAKLPIYLYQSTPRGPREIEDHPALAVINSPGDLHTGFELRQMMELGKGLGGNGYARVFRDEFYQPRAIQWIKPSEIRPEIATRPNGEKFAVYRVEGIAEALTRADIIHVRGTISGNGLTGVSPIGMLRESIGTARAQTRAAGAMMKNGSRFPSYLVAKDPLTDDQLKDAREEWDAKQAGAANSGRMPLLNANFDVKSVSGMSMQDAQFIESRRFELQEIARIYGIPGFLIGDTTSSTTWGSGIEQQTLGFLNFCLDPHLVGWEQSLAHTLLTTEEIRAGYHFKFDRDELANVSLEAKAAFYQTMRNIGVFSPNDVRSKLDEPLIETPEIGDNYGLPFNASGGTPNATPEPSNVTE